jgi:hypothetical protein
MGEYNYKTMQDKKKDKFHEIQWGSITSYHVAPFDNPRSCAMAEYSNC